MSTFSEIYFNGNQYNQMWLNGSKIWEKASGGIVDEYPEYDTVVVYYVSTGSVSSMFGNSDYRPPKIDSSLSASYTHLWTDGKYQCYGLNNYYPSGQDNSYSNTIYPVQIRKVSLPKGVEYADGSLILGSSTSNSFIREYCRNTTSASSELYPPYIDWTFLDLRKVKEIRLLYSVTHATTLGNINVWDTSYLTSLNQVFAYSGNGFCSKLTSLNVSGWNTSNITNMNSAFYGMTSLQEPLDVSSFDTSNVTSMSYMFYAYPLKELDLSSFDTSKVTSYSDMFKGVSNCTVYIGDNWTLGTSATLGGGTNNTFIKLVPIESMDLICSEDVVTQTKFTITPVCMPINWAEPIKVEYDSTYLRTDDNYTFYVLDGGQGKTFDITYKGKNVSKTITVTVAEELRENTVIDFTGKTMTTLPTWFTEQAKGSTYWFEHATYANDSSIYGLVNNNRTNDGTTAWSCYKLVAPITAPLEITYRAISISASYPFTIHITTSASQPSYSTSSNRIAYANSSTDTGEVSVTYDVVEGTTYYIHFQKYRYYYSSSYAKYGAVIRSIKLLQPVAYIDLSYDVDLSNIETESFIIKPITNDNADMNDLEIIYDSTYMSVNKNTFEIKLFNGSQGMSHSVTYRSKADNSISKSITFYVNPNLEIQDTLIDFTQPTAPTLPSYMTVDGTSTYKFNHGTYTTDVYGLIPSNKGKDSSTAYTRYKYVAPTTGTLQFTYRCYAETSYDYLTVHVNTSTSQPSTTNATNQVFTTKGVSSYQNTDGTASVSVVEGTTYYIHIQYYKDSSQASGYDMGCIRKIELV